MTILNFGSLNVDRVLRVGHIARPGETIGSTSSDVFAGGKGANQSVSLARAGAAVAHLGKVGPDGQWLLDKLAREGVETRWVRVGSGPTGQAMIQVDDAGQNAIVLVGGANDEITPDEVDEALESFAAGAWLLVQNETSAVAHAIDRARRRGMRVAFNPAPFDNRVRQYPLEQLDLLCLNETEGAAMTGEGAAEAICAALAAELPDCEIVLTLGAAGVLRAGPEGTLRCDACRVAAVDTTAAGDTFLGYYLAGRAREDGVRESLELACRAAALCVTRAGAMDSIPRLAEVLKFS
jgi:ribokinase